jgi:hypothetical protein
VCLGPEYDGGVALDSVEGREWGGATGRHCRFLVQGLAVWLLIRHLVVEIGSRKVCLYLLA